MKHTFVIPVYGASPYLEACILSLKAQTVPAAIIITTSTPSAVTTQLAKQYGINYKINPNPQGIAADWNFALASAATPLVTIAHQDDVYEPNYAETVTNQLAFFEAQNVLIAFTGYRDIVNDQPQPGGINMLVKQTMLLPFAFSKCIGNRFIKQWILRFGDPVCCPAVTYNMAALGSNFKFNNNYQVALDWEAWYRLALQKGAFLYIRQPLMQHRVHAQSTTAHQINSGLRLQEERRILELLWGKFAGTLISRLYALGHRYNLKA